MLNDREKQIHHMMDSAEVVTEALSGIYQSLAQKMPEDIAAEAFRYLLDSQRLEQEKTIEELRLRVASAYGNEN